MVEWVNPYKENDCGVINPCNEEPFATISLGSKEDTDLAVKAAKIAFESWKETTKEERIDYLEKLLSIYKKRFGEMAEANFTRNGSSYGLGN
jgi:aldehyde dehydrogenase (NAD+)